MKVTIGEVIALVIILTALSAGFLSATPTTSSHTLTIIPTSAITKFLGGSWSLNYSYVGTGYNAKLIFLQSYKNSQVVYETLTDPAGDELIILYVYPSSHGVTSVYSTGYVVLYSAYKGNAYVMINYVGNTTAVSVSQIESLANYIISTE
ncbi:hypothetical protein V6M85_08325 [Sulfolobus tengchongensis]|uniref:Uncharacterized protein n=1 Tax=Sulfolobus tengchongensis TaxID=207809 RepID=A0AAX4KXF2_9CREN